MAQQIEVANPFPRTLRSLKSDRHTIALLGLLTVVLLLLIWGIWFFGTTIPILQSSEQAQLTSAQRVMATYPLEAIDMIKRGQSANFYPEGNTWQQDSPIPAFVTRVTTDASTSQTRVELVLRPERRFSTPMKQGLSGLVEIEMERVSPATLLFRASGVADDSINQSEPQIDE